MHKAIFLDRDGVINHDPGDYTKNLKEFRILPGVFDALKKFQSKGYLLILITNQGGIAKGLYGHAEVKEIHDYFVGSCKDLGISITDIYYSPHHDDFGRSLTRKPGSLMIERALSRYDIDPSQSYMIGDKTRDVVCGEAAGVKGIKMAVNGSLIDILDQIN